MRTRPLGVASLFVLAVVSVASGAAAQSIEVIAAGLVNPRGLAFGPEGALYVVEAGSGGTMTPCLPAVDAAGPRCAGMTGAVTRIWPLAPGTQERVATGLPSAAGPDGAGATGAHDISFQGRGGAFITFGLGGSPDSATRQALVAQGAPFGYLAQMPASGKWKTVVDVAAHELANPDGEVLDSNPYGVLALPGRRIVADAGANALVEVAANRDTRTLAVFPRTGFQAVPTSVAQGPDGDLYVGQLTGFPFPVGAACVFRVPSEGGAPVCAYGGFTNIIDLTFGPDGSLYVLELDANGLLAAPPFGRLTRIATDGTRSVVLGDSPQMVMPGGVAVSADGAIYVTNLSVSPGGGQVLKIVP